MAADRLAQQAQASPGRETAGNEGGGQRAKATALRRNLRQGYEVTRPGASRRVQCHEIVRASARELRESEWRHGRDPRQTFEFEVAQVPRSCSMVKSLQARLEVRVAARSSVPGCCPTRYRQNIHAAIAALSQLAPIIPPRDQVAHRITQPPALTPVQPPPGKIRFAPSIIDRLPGESDYSVESAIKRHTNRLP